MFQYDPEESEDSAQLMGIAMQDDKGQWYGLNKFTLDTVAKTISGIINHFSTWAAFDKLKLKFMFPRNRLKVRKTESLGIWGVDMTPEQKDINNSDGLSPLSNWKRPKKGVWRVNGIIKGNSEFGTLEKGTVNESNAKMNNYTAPANVPDWNPVTISVELEGASFKIGGKTVTNPRLSTKILIYDDAYEVKMIHSYIGYAGPGSWQGNLFGYRQFCGKLRR